MDFSSMVGANLYSIYTDITQSLIGEYTFVEVVIAVD